MLIDTNIFLRLAFEEPGWEQCGDLLDTIHSGKEDGVISALQLSELYTPFERTKDYNAKVAMKTEIEKLKLKVRSVDAEIAELSSEIRAIEKTPQGNWFPLADSIILATAIVENVETLFTIDTDFSKTKRVRISAPGMSIETWIKRYG